MELFDTYQHTSESITEKISEILATERPKVDRKEALRFILSSIDLTTLNGNDTETTVRNLCEKALSFEDKAKGIPSVAAVCVYPPFVRQAKQMLSESGIGVASVAGCFPSGQSPLNVKLLEVGYVVAEGADEVDMVISRGKFLEGKYKEVGEEVAAIKQVCGRTHLKVILETGELNSIANIRKASEIAIRAGGDFIKTSTGKITPAATLETAWVMMETIAEYYRKTNIQIGFKPAGGIAEPDDAIDYYILLRHILGKRWMNKDLFRIGASRLADKIFRTLKLLFFGVLLSLLAGCTPEGDDDFSLPRDKYIGSWFCQDDGGAVGYYATISSDPSNSTQVLIKNYFDYRGTVYAIVTDATITVPNQKMQGISNTVWCEGNGALSTKNGKYTIHWALYGLGNEDITSIYTKQ